MGRRDYIVKRRDLFDLTAEAKKLRRALLGPTKGKLIDPKVVLNILRERDLLGKGQLKIAMQSHSDEKPACVSFNPLVLHVSKKIWEDADDDRKFARWAFARWVLWHEIGHIFLHDHTARPYSHDDSSHIRLPKEESGEWQADTFGMALATGFDASISSLDVYSVSTLFGLPEEISEELIELCSKYVHHKGPKIQVKQRCPDCGNTMSHTGSYLECSVCIPPVRFAL